MSTIAVFLALGGGSFAAVSGDKDSGGQGAQEEQGGGGNSDGDNAGKDSKGDKGDKGNNDGNGSGDTNEGNNNPADANADQNDALNITTRQGDPAKSDPDSDEAVASASCEDGERLVGGGVLTNSEKQQVRGQTIDSQPMVMSSGPDGNGWSARVMDSAGVGVTATAYAICASGSASSGDSAK